jgi:hypothetical protein
MRGKPSHSGCAWKPTLRNEMLTFWDDVDAIKRFAGEEDFQLAKFYDFDRAFLVEPEL